MEGVADKVQSSNHHDTAHAQYQRADKRDFVQKGMAPLLLLMMFSALCGSMATLKLPQYPYVDSVVPYKDPGIGSTTCALAIYITM